MNFDVDFKQRLRQAQRAKRKNLGLPEPDPSFRKYTRLKTVIMSSTTLCKGVITHRSGPIHPEYEYKWMSEKEYVLSCLKNEGWQLSKKW